ncbi:DUF192 domain-containing protein [Salipaludibacillus agaradhaerens]|nr:DUF192 domain-containing protein [Salipaludibacillus agaradhaerens]MCR6117571.1 DUF192 domain-containing protein [Salipaludibacillus agaradhaerens]UJW56757.1 DUF192 domain-containing protein [Bacillus sp. A116_S68]
MKEPVFNYHTFYTSSLIVIKATTFRTRYQAWRFKRRIRRNQAIWLIPCQSIHTFFMFFSIDVVFLDKEHRIICCIKRLKPYSHTPPILLSHSAVIFPKNTINLRGFKEGDILNLSQRCSCLSSCRFTTTDRAMK